jgi:hypothetical protein
MPWEDRMALLAEAQVEATLALVDAIYLAATPQKYTALPKEAL